MKYILLASLLFIFFSCTQAGTEKLPKIKVESKVEFNGDNISYGYATQKSIEILNVGEGILSIKSITLDKSKGEIDYRIVGYEASNIAQYEILEFPHKLKKDEWMKILLEIKPTDEGLKETKITIESNDEKNPISVIEVSASKFSPDLFVIKSGVPGVDISSLVIKKCTETISQGTLIDVCNRGKGTLFISDIKLTGDAESISYIKLEEVNYPVKMRGTEGAANCIQKLAICHTADAAATLDARLEIKNNASSDYIIDLEK